MNDELVDTVGWTLIHFVWEGAAVALVAAFAGRALRAAAPSTRYATFCAALALMALLPVATFAILSASPAVSAAIAATSTAVAVPSAPAAAPAPASALTRASGWMPWLVAAWALGVGVLAVRACGGLVLTQRLRRVGTSPAADWIAGRARALSGTLGIRRSVRILESVVADVPAAIGWLRPVVLLPVSAVTAMAPAQIELLLAHELAHVRRRDYLVNLVQTAVETVLFYHPAVWWIGAEIRAEREHCCDDLAVQACGDPAAYARTLAMLEGLRGARLRFAVAANGGSLLGRVERLLGRGARRGTSSPAWAGALFPAALVVVATLAPAAPPAVEAGAAAAPQRADGFLAGLTAAGYTQISIDDVIALRDHGLDAGYIGAMVNAGLGTPGVRALIDLHDHGVPPEFVATVVRSGLASDFSFANAIRMRDHGVDPDALGRIRALGFGPYPSSDIVALQDHGTGPASFEALAEAGLVPASVEDAIAFCENGITRKNILSMKRQGFTNMTLEQILKLRRGGII